MHPIEDMSAWSIDDVKGAILAALPAELRFENGLDPEAGAWMTRFFSRDEAGEERVLFEDWGVDHRILLFNALGWLMQRSQPKPAAGSPWVRRHDDTRPRVAKVTFRGAGAPDPADLDLDQIQTVYGGPGQPK